MNRHLIRLAHDALRSRTSRQGTPSCRWALLCAVSAALLLGPLRPAQAAAPGTEPAPTPPSAVSSPGAVDTCADPLATVRGMTTVDVVFGGHHVFRLASGGTSVYQSITLAEASSGALDRTDFGPAGNATWAARTFSQDAVAQQTFDGALVATLTLHGSGTVAADGKSLESLDLAMTPWYSVISGAPAAAVRSRRFVLAGPIPLTACSADAVEFSVSGSAVQPRITSVLAKNGNTANYAPVAWYEGTDWATAPTPGLTVRFSGPAARIEGQIYAPIGYTDSNAGFPDAVQFSGRAPLAGVKVDLVQMTEVGGQRTFTQLSSTIADDEGRYRFSGVPVANSLVISTTLRGADLRVLDAASSPTNYATLPSPARDVSVQSAAFSVASPGVVVEQDVAYDKAQAHISPVAGSVAADRLDDFGLIYYHAHQAFELTKKLGLALDTKPVPLYAYLPGEAGAYWWGPVSTGANAAIPPHIVIGGVVANRARINSDVNSSDRPDNREWHEFGHHVMADALGNKLPDDPGTCPNPPAIGRDCNHYGYFNVSTTDSWTEGFAEFFSMVVNREIARDGTPAYLYRWAGSETSGASNLETNFKAWRTRDDQSFEEFAVAGLLWDLLDGKAEGDVTVLARSGAGGTVVRATYADHVSMDLATLWSSLTHNAGGAYGYILTIKDLYDVLKAAGVGQDAAGPGGMTALDELFVAHGFFADTGANRRFYDAGEVVGASGYLAFTVSYTVNNVPQVLAVPAQPARRSPPPVPDAVVQVAPGKYTISVHFEPPAAYYDFSYDVATADGALLLLVADADYAASVSIVPANSSGYEPLVLTNDFLWNAPADGNGVILSHTFVRGPLDVYLPLVLRSPPPTPTPTPTATATPTRTATPTPTVTPSGAPGIQGYITYNTAPAAAVELRLRFYNGSSYSTTATTQTDSLGNYRFAGVPSLAAGQLYYVRYGPNTSDPKYLGGWYGPSLTSYTAGARAAGGDFDLANVLLSAPAPGTTSALPVTFAWQRRSLSADTYRLVLFDPDTNDTWTTDDLGHTDRVTVTALPAGIATGKPYGWYVEVWQGNDSYGVSYYYRLITFAAAGSQRSTGPADAGRPDWHAGQSPEAPKPRRQD